ncbi:MAG: radical SAM family heme chaperone HemW [Bacteroidota bacterium]|nr:radical SAM family heme chaperone HemW [Bacteroidota bacterium]
MSGIYIHIPYCTKACHYCNFHFSTSFANKVALIKCILKEIDLQKDYLSDKNIDTIYFGGGTPSLLNIGEISQILYLIQKNFNVSNNVEITLEGNPEDLSLKKCLELKAVGINRLSIGIQTFNDQLLKWMNRSHSSEEATNSLNAAFEAGFTNISADLIYGIPFVDHTVLENDLLQILQFNLPHLSAYCLTIEDKTPFGNLLKRGTMIPISDIYSSEQFEKLMNSFSIAGYEQYEISNYALNKAYSKHNTSYWQGTHYLGIGPGAHSYNGTTRQWNVSNNNKYINALNDSIIPLEKESLTQSQIFNEYIMTRLRTIWGINSDELIKILPDRKETFMQSVENFISDGMIYKNKNFITLTQKGKFFADRISSELFV